MSRGEEGGEHGDFQPLEANLLLYKSIGTALISPGPPEKPEIDINPSPGTNYEYRAPLVQQQ